jgi:hypothetical protein
VNNKYVSRLIVFAITIIAAVLLWPYFTQVDLPEANMSSSGAATVNTLVLAYASGALPMLLMFSLGLVTAIPLTTAIAILFALRADSLGKWRQVLGLEGSATAHIH